ncbi:MAG TPA: type II toxin-antitoxin system HipA family toxin [Ramlibacter sp.]|uniref:type II toxin-antitoxin system HipA family toxin n=1 Tax=Ramlibacter sp. TaxID=1917967 RepID=UPI002ED0BD27
MGRASHARALSLWSNGHRVGSWRIPARGEMELQYEPAWRAADVGRPLSLSLPFDLDDRPLKGAALANYFENLLPDSAAIRKRLAQRYARGSTDAFDLLAAIGRDCVGAVQLLPEDQAPEGFDRIEGTPLSDDDIARHLRTMVTAPARGLEPEEADFRISLAGAQEKTALLRHEGRWLRPHGATPTTHIFKLPIGLVGHMRADFTTSVQNEWLTMEIVRAYGLAVARCEMLEFDGQPVLCVERFDRQLHPSGQWWMRLPQEDFCQATGHPPDAKYQAEGGPGVLDIARLLRGSDHAHADIETVLACQVLFWMLAATDGHAKNFSIRLLAGGRFRLTPLYDIMSVWPIAGDGPNQLSWQKAKLAMAVMAAKPRYRLREIERRHFNAMAARCGYGADAEPVIGRLLEATPGVIRQVRERLPHDFPERVATRIFAGLQGAAERLAAMPAK